MSVDYYYVEIIQMFTYKYNKIHIGIKYMYRVVADIKK